MRAGASVAVGRSVGEGAGPEAALRMPRGVTGMGLGEGPRARSC